MVEDLQINILLQMHDFEQGGDEQRRSLQRGETIEFVKKKKEDLSWQSKSVMRKVGDIGEFLVHN
eukprot:911603-Heterocapsa_arctica.AAC.1